MLSGHTDVVPVAGQDWHTEPFVPVEKDGRLYGRGTTDMKSFVGTALALVPDFVAADLSRPIHFAFTYDEEVGCLGRTWAGRTYSRPKAARPGVVLVGEPTRMKVVNSHKGLQSYQTVITGKEAHSSAPHLGANAIVAAGQLDSVFVGDVGQPQKRYGDKSGRFDPGCTRRSMWGALRGARLLTSFPKPAALNGSFAPCRIKTHKRSLRRFTPLRRSRSCPGFKDNAHLRRLLKLKRVAMIPPFIAR